MNEHRLVYSWNGHCSQLSLLPYLVSRYLQRTLCLAQGWFPEWRGLSGRCLGRVRSKLKCCYFMQCRHGNQMDNPLRRIAPFQAMSKLQIQEIEGKYGKEGRKCFVYSDKLERILLGNLHTWLEGYQRKGRTDRQQLDESSLWHPLRFSIPNF